jgi:hypothetical protein
MWCFLDCYIFTCSFITLLFWFVRACCFMSGNITLIWDNYDKAITHVPRLSRLGVLLIPKQLLNVFPCTLVLFHPLFLPAVYICAVTPYCPRGIAVPSFGIHLRFILRSVAVQGPALWPTLYILRSDNCGKSVEIARRRLWWLGTARWVCVF